MPKTRFTPIGRGQSAQNADTITRSYSFLSNIKVTACEPLSMAEERKYGRIINRTRRQARELARKYRKLAAVSGAHNNFRRLERLVSEDLAKLAKKTGNFPPRFKVKSRAGVSGFDVFGQTVKHLLLEIQRLAFFVLFPKEITLRCLRSNFRAIMTVARKYSRKSGAVMNIEDLIQSGAYGFMEGLWHYNYKTGARLLTYAVNWVEHWITRELESKGYISYARLPVHVKELQERYYRFEIEFLAHNGRQPTNEEAAARLKLSKDKIAKIRLGMSLDKPFSIDENMGKNEIDIIAQKTRSAFLSDNSSSPEDITIMSEYLERLRHLREFVCAKARTRETSRQKIKLGAIADERLLKELDDKKTLKELGDTELLSRESIRLFEAEIIKSATPHVLADFRDVIDLYRKMRRKKEKSDKQLARELILDLPTLIGNLEKAVNA